MTQSMSLDEAIRRRRMCRSFSERAVPAEVVDRLLDRARRAPSAGHSQGWGFLVLESPEDRGRFWSVTSDPSWLAEPDMPGLLRAPVIIVPMCSSGVYLERYSEPDKIAHGLTVPEAWPAPFWTIDVSFATMLLLLGVVVEGLGALFFGIRGSPDRLRNEFGVPAGWEAIGAVAVGWRAEEDGPVGSATRGRKGLGEIVHRGRW